MEYIQPWFAIDLVFSFWEALMKGFYNILFFHGFYCTLLFCDSIIHCQSISVLKLQKSFKGRWMNQRLVHLGEYSLLTLITNRTVAAVLLSEGICPWCHIITCILRWLFHLFKSCTCHFVMEFLIRWLVKLIQSFCQF